MSADIPMTSVARAQRWVLAIPWHAVMRWGAPWNRFGLVARPARSDEAAFALLEDYQIRTRHDVERTLASLMASARARDAAWHLSNAVLVAELAYAAFLLDEAQAWQAAVDAARSLQNHHRGWFAMAEAYLRGLATHRPDSGDTAVRELLVELHAKPQSPWNALAWSTPLPEVIPPPRFEHQERVFAVSDAASLREMLKAHPGARLRLGPGTYRGSFRLRDHVLERDETTPFGSVVIEADGGPGLLAEGGVWCRGLIVQAGETPPTDGVVVLNGRFARIEDCRFEGGHRGIAGGAADDGQARRPIVQLESLAFEGLSDSAVTLTEMACSARDISISTIGGSGFALERSRLDLEDAFIEGVDRAGVIAQGGGLKLERVRIHDAERWGVALSRGARAELHDCEVMRSIVGLMASSQSSLVAERCRFADSATANVELLDIGSARFSHCHVTGGEWAGVRLHPGSGALFDRGQIGGSRQACVMIEGGRNITLSRVGVGPSREGGGLFLADGAEVEADGVFVTGAALAGVELRASTLVASDLRVRGSVEGVLVRDGGRLEGHRLDLAEIRGTGLWMAGGSAAVAGLGLRKVGFGVVVATSAVALVQDLVASHTPVTIQVEGGRVALAGRITTGNGALRAKGGQLAARGLEGIALTASDAELYLEAGSAVSAGAIDVEGRSRVVLVRVELADDAVCSTPSSEIVTDPTGSPMAVAVPLAVALEPERFEHWGATPTPALLHRLVGRLRDALGLVTLVVRRTRQGVHVDGELAAITRLAPALSRILGESGAFGVALAALLGDGKQQLIMPGGPPGLA